MSQNIGDLKISVILDILQAEKSAGKYTTSLKHLEAEHNKVTKTSKALESQTVSLKGKLQNIGLAVDGLRATFSILRSTFGDMISSYNQQEIAIAKLANGLKNVGESANAINKLSKQSSELQKVTVYDDDEIINAQSMLTTFMKSSDEIEILTPRLLDLSAAFDQSGEGGKSLQEVAVMLGKVNEETIGALRRVGVAFSKEQEEKLKSLKGTEQAIYLSEILDQNFKNMAITVGQTAGGQFTIFQNNVRNLKEEFGKLLSGVLTPLLKPMGEFINYLNNAPSGIKQTALALTSLSLAFTFLNGSIPSSIKFISIFAAFIPSLPQQLKAVAVALTAVATAFALINIKADSLKLGLNTLATSSKTSIANFANSVSLNFGAVGFAISLLIGWVTLLIGKIRDLNEEGENLEKWENIRRNGGKIYVQTLDENIDITDPKNPKKTSTFQYSYTPNKGFIGEETSTGVPYGPEITPEQRDLLPKDEPKTKSPGNGKVISDVKEFVGYLTVLNKQLDEIKIKIDNQSEGESIAEGLFGTKKELEDRIEFINKLNSLGPSGFLKEKFQREIVSGIKVPEKRFGGVLSDSNVNPFDNDNDNGNKATIKDKLDQSISAAQNIASILGFGAENFVSKFLSGLNNGISLVSSIAKILSLFGSGGLTGIFSVLGLASGGLVPGSGSGDSVPAMLTPGEFVITKSRAGQLGTRFLQWLNGGGSVQSLAPGAFASLGNTSQVIEVPYIVSHKVEGNDLRTILSRVNKTNNRRML